MNKIYLLFLFISIAGFANAQSTRTTNDNRENVSKSQSSAAASKNEIPELPGFPKYTNTGDKEKDAATYKEAKEKWIKENQATYDAYLGRKSKDASLSADIEYFKDLPGFPQYVDTGNPEQDRYDYKIARITWIKENQEAYNNYVQSKKQ